MSVHACLAPQCPPLSTACSPQGCLFVNLDSIQTTVLCVGVGGGGHAYCCKQGKREPEAPPLTHLVPSPCSAPPPPRRVTGGTSQASFVLSGAYVPLGGQRGRGTEGRGKVPGGRESRALPFKAPRFGTKHYRSHRPPGTCGCPCD